MTDYARIERIIRHLDAHYRDQPTLTELAQVAGLSEFHFHRLFTRWAGTTPKNFLKALTAEHAKQLLLESKDLLTVSFEAGLSGPSRLHDLMIAVEGVTPGEFKSGGSGVTIHYGVHPTPFGQCVIATTTRGICHLAFADPSDPQAGIADLRERWPRAVVTRSQHATASLVDRMFHSGDASTSVSPVSLVLTGTPFQLKVWKALLTIPEGYVTSYSAVASAIGHPGAARAVGSAVGKNPIAVLIPCHRVIRETGVVGDYHWGTTRKKALLAWEFGRRMPRTSMVDSYDP